MEYIEPLSHYISNLSEEIKYLLSINGILIESLSSFSQELSALNQDTVLSDDAIETIDKNVKDIQTLLHHYGLKTILSKLLKRKKTSKKSKLDLFKDSVQDLVKLLSIVQMLAFREQQNNNFDKCEPTVLWIGVSSVPQQQSLDPRSKLVIKYSLVEACEFLNQNSQFINIPVSHFRIVIDKEVDFQSCQNFFDWMKEKNFYCPICIICKDILEFIPLLTRINNVSLGPTPAQFQFFISSMSYRPKVRNIVTFSQLQQQKKGGGEEEEDDDGTDEDEDEQHKEAYRSLIHKSQPSSTLYTQDFGMSLEDLDTTNTNTTTTTTTTTASNTTSSSTTPNKTPDSARSTRFQTLKNMSASKTYSTPYKSPASSTSTSPNDINNTTTATTNDTPTSTKSSPLSISGATIRNTPNQSKIRDFNLSQSFTPSTPSSLNSSSIFKSGGLSNSTTGTKLSNTSDSIPLDPSHNRISSNTTTLSLSEPLQITTGRVMSTHIHLRDALDNPVQTLITSNHSGYGPVSSAPIQTYLEGPPPLQGVPIPTYIYVVGPGILGVSFFPTHNGTYFLHANLDGTPIKNSPCTFLSSNNIGTNPQLDTKTLVKKRKVRGIPNLDFETGTLAINQTQPPDEDDLLDLLSPDKKQKQQQLNVNNINNNNNSNNSLTSNNSTNTNNSTTTTTTSTTTTTTTTTTTNGGEMDNSLFKDIDYSKKPQEPFHILISNINDQKSPKQNSSPDEQILSSTISPTLLIPSSESHRSISPTLHVSEDQFDSRQNSYEKSSIPVPSSNSNDDGGFMETQVIPSSDENQDTTPTLEIQDKSSSENLPDTQIVATIPVPDNNNQQPTTTPPTQPNTDNHIFQQQQNSIVNNEQQQQQPTIYHETSATMIIEDMPIDQQEQTNSNLQTTNANNNEEHIHQTLTLAIE
eukprot:gene6238-7769_t